MPQVLANLLSSEKGVMALLVIVATAVLAALGRIEPTTEQWLEYSTIWLGIYTGGKTIQGAASAIANRPTPAPHDVTSATTVNVTPPQGGFAEMRLLVVLGVASLLLWGAVVGCSLIKGESKKVIDSIVDCTTGTAKQAVDELAPVVDVVVSQSINASGRVEPGPVRDIAKQFATSISRCVLADSFSRLINGVLRVGGPQGADQAVDRDAARATFRALSVELFNGQTFKTSSGGI